MNEERNNKEYYEVPYVSQSKESEDMIKDKYKEMPNVSTSNYYKKKKSKKSFSKLGSIVVILIVGIISGSISGYFTAKYVLKNSNTGGIFESSDYSVDALNMNDSNLDKSILDCVVAIDCDVKSGYQTGVTSGSGVVISTDGYILTNYHVVEDSSSIRVTTNSSEKYEAVLVGHDENTDIAILKVDGSNLTAVKIGDSSALDVGQTVFAIGNPLGVYAGTLTKGVISATDREITIDSKTMNLIQTDASINSGNSGGALVNENGELVGIVTAKSSGYGVEGLGFAIPINDIKDVINDLMEYGYVTGRVSFGITVTEVNDSKTWFYSNGEESGVYVVSVNDGSCAKKAGMVSGDCIIKINDAEISSYADLNKAMKNYKPKDKVNVTIKRDGKEKILTVTLDEYLPN